MQVYKDYSRRNSKFMKFAEETQYQPDSCTILSASFNHSEGLSTSARTAEQRKNWWKSLYRKRISIL